MSILTSIAINAALSSDWEKAISTNLEILAQKQDDIEAMSRLAYAYLQSNKLDKAKKLYQSILSIDKYNIVAQKNLDKINSLPKSKNVNHSKTSSLLSPHLFIEEPGKTKTVTLTNIAPVSTLSKLYIGDTVLFHAKKHSIEIRDGSKTYLGALPDDIAFRLLRFLKGGNIYHVIVKNIAKNSLSVYIRELKRGKRFQFQPTFVPSANEYTPGTSRVVKRALKSEVEEESTQDEEE